MFTPSPFEIDSGRSVDKSTRFSFEPETVSTYLREVSQSTSGYSSDLSVDLRARSQSNPVEFRSSDHDVRMARKRKYTSHVLGTLSVIPRVKRSLLGCTSSKESLVNSYRIEVAHGAEMDPSTDNDHSPDESTMNMTRDAILNTLIRKFVYLDCLKLKLQKMVKIYFI